MTLITSHIGSYVSFTMPIELYKEIVKKLPNGKIKKMFLSLEIAITEEYNRSLKRRRKE